MRILIVTLHYLPDGGPSAPLFGLLAESLVGAGHSVTVVAGTPHYPSGRTLTGWEMPPDGCEEVRGVRVLRTRIPSGNRANLAFRSLQFAAFQLGAARLLAGDEEFDAAIFVNPALQVWLPWLVARSRVRGPRVFSIHDVYPDVGTRLGIFKAGLSDRIVGALESYCVRTADRVRILSPAFRAPAERLGATPERLSLIYDWTDTTFITPQQRENAFRAEFGLSGKFVFMYAGNVGLSQGLETLVEAAIRLDHHPDVRFVIVGGGAGLDPLRQRAEAAGTKNVVFVPFQSRERLPDVLGAADVGLILLRPGLTDSLPSKVYSIMSSGRPVLASVDECNDVCEIIAQANCGICVPPGDAGALVAACESFVSLAPARLAESGAAGRRYVEARHSPRAAAERFLEIMRPAGPNGTGMHT